MNIFFCLSYLSIPHTLTLINQREGSNFVIISANPQLVKFFRELFPEKVKQIESFSYSIINSKSILLLPISLFRILKLKQRTWEYFKNFKNCNIYFFFNTAAFSFAWLIYKLSKNNHLLYQEDIDLSSYTRKTGFFPTISKYFIRFVYKEEVNPIDQGNGLTSYKMSKKFLNKVKAKFLQLDLDYLSLSKWVAQKIKLPEGNILMVTNWMPEHGVTIEEHIQFNDALIKDLLDHGYNPHFKMHSRAKNKYSLEKTLLEVPKYYPASMLLSYKIFIGYVSSALIEASNNGLVSISLIDYIPTCNQERKKDMKNFLMTNSTAENEILFPSSLSEIKSIIENSKELK